MSQEFGHGFWDGITGLVTQPILGAKKEGGAGFVKGIGRGIAGVVVKPGAGIYGLPGYAMKGIYKEVQRHFGKSVDNYIIAARTAQGWEMFLQIDKDEQMQIVHRYLRLMEEVKRKKIVGEDSVEAVQDFIEHRKEKRREKWARFSAKKEQISGEFKDKGKKWGGKVDRWQDHVHPNRTNSLASSVSRHPSTGGKSTSELVSPEHRQELADTSLGRGLAVHERPLPERSASTGGLRHTATAPHEQTYYYDSDDEDYKHDVAFEKALQDSIKQTSQGDADEDRQIDQAIRASIAHLQRTITNRGDSSSAAQDDEADDEQLKLAIAESLKGLDGGPSSAQETGVLRPPAIPPKSPRRSRSPFQHEAIAGAAQQVNTSEPGGSSLVADAHTAADAQDHDEDLKKALAESQKMGEDDAKAKREEEIVLEYVKKQSLLEENYRKGVSGQGGEGSSSGTQ
jgi:hypothetical protein